MKNIFVLSAVAVAVLGSASPVMAAGTVNIDVEFYSPIRTLTKKSYGAGFDFYQAYMRNIFKDALVWTPTGNVSTLNSYNALKNLNLGSYRFSMGTSALFYYWDNVCRSYNETAIPASQFLLPEEVFEGFLTRGTNVSGYATTRPALGGTGTAANDILWQVNTNSAVHGNDCSNPTSTAGVHWRFSEKRHPVTNQPYVPTQLDDDTGPSGSYVGSGLYYVALNAGKLVQTNRAKPAEHQIENWEIGNEDWARMTPEQYARIFVKVGLEMKVKHVQYPGARAGNPFRLIAQTVVNANKDWNTRFANELKTYGALAANKVTVGSQVVSIGLSDVYALSLHPYITGNKQTSIEDRTKVMFSKVDWVLDVRYTEDDIYAIASSNGITPWKLWVTEYAACEECGQDSEPYPIQTYAHGMVVADMTATLLARGVERTFYHSLDQHPKFAMLNWDNNGGSYTAPLHMATGILLGKMANSMVGTMYPTTVTGYSGGYAVNASAPGTGPTNTYYTLTSYAVHDATKASVTIMLVNRDLASPTTVTLTPVGGKVFNTAVGKTYVTSTLQGTGSSGKLLSTNIGATPSTLPVKLLDSAPQAVTSTINVTVPAAGVVFLTVPVL